MRTCRCTSSREKAARWVVSGSESERTRDRSWFIFTFLIFILCFKGAFWQQMLTHMKPSLSVDVKITRWLSVNVRQFRIFTLFYNLHSLSYKMNHLGINPLRCSDAENKFTIHSRRLHEGVKNDMQTVKKNRARMAENDVSQVGSEHVNGLLCCCHAGLIAADPQQYSANVLAIKAANNMPTNSTVKSHFLLLFKGNRGLIHSPPWWSTVTALLYLTKKWRRSRNSIRLLVTWAGGTLWEQ